MTFDVDNLPDYAGKVFDHLVARPELVRLLTWKQLERPGATDLEASAYRVKTEAVASAQRQALIDANLEPADLLALVLALTQAWFTVAGGMNPSGGSGLWSEEQLAQHRAAVVHAVRRITAPRG
ncbi:hypothetical protein ACIQVT_01940 [Streptomyces sp. NPDC100445]|uniref:hypothetical protein n=1 Tax=Streptomyces sp. NPDC100445 TaxID=3366102 RepID=UPI00380F2BE3